MVKTTDPQNEVFDVVNENDEVVGEATRGEVHQNPKLIHRAVHIWVLNDKGEILLQQRSLTKDKAPGQWDISCAGHVQKGNSAEMTAERELQEELGVKAKFRLIKKFIDKDIDQTEMVSLYYAFHNGPFKFPKDEIQQVKFFAKDKVLDFIKNDPDVSISSKEEIPMVFEFLERK
jgi:isopentenyl-diphosphate delta-isomerase type 1